jgi:hypothetical protein
MHTNNETRANLSIPQFNADKSPKMDDKGEEQLIEIKNNIDTSTKSYREIVAEASANGLTEMDITTKLQSFQVTEVDSWKELFDLIGLYQPDATIAEKVATDIVNRGLILAQQHKGMREFMNDSDQPVVEGLYDVMAEASKPGEGRRRADPLAKAAKLLSEQFGVALTPADLDRLVAAFKSEAI